MKLLEYSSKEIFKMYGIPVQTGITVFDGKDVEDALEKINFPVVIKAQVPVGGRGKAGGVKIAHSRDDALKKEW